MKRLQIDLRVTDQDTMHVEAYLSPTDGLAIHRQVVWVPGKEEHKATSKWTITHIASGRQLLRPSECTDTMHEAGRIAAALKGHDWTQVDPLSVEGLHARVLEAVASSGGPDIPEDLSGPQSAPQRFVVRRNHGGSGYNVIDSMSDDVIENFVHRGLAKQFADEKNGQVTT